MTKLSVLALVLGLGYGLPQILGLVRPQAWREAWRGFPRSANWGWPLMLAATAWFLWNLNSESISDFAQFKPAMLGAFAAIGLGTCVFVRDFLPVRGLAILLLLLGKVMVDTARWSGTEWLMVISGWAYLLVLGGMWFTISPWRFRDWLQWSTATDERVRILCGLRLSFGLAVAVLGLTVFRTGGAV